MFSSKYVINLIFCQSSSKFHLFLQKWYLYYKCTEDKPTASNNNFYACDTGLVYPVCPTGQFISSGSVKYGRWDNSICPGPGVNNTTPASYGTFNLPFTCLKGVNACPLGIGKDLVTAFGDPAPGVTKHVSECLLLDYFSTLFNLIVAS